MKTTVAVIGSGRLDPSDSRWALAEELGRALVDAGYRIVCGGRGGVMTAVCRGGRSSPNHQDGDLIGILPGDGPQQANAFVDIALPTGLGHARNTIVAHADVVVAVGGGAGTLSEMALAWVHNRPIYAFRVAGWSGRLADQALDRSREDVVIGVDRPEEIIAALG